MATSTPARSADVDAAQMLRASIAAGRFEVPMLSRTAGQVIAICAGDGGDARSLAHLIQQDPALAAEVLRIANSASFGAGEPVVSLQQAIARMGLDRVREIALAIALKSDMFKSRVHEARLRGVWRAAVATAAWAREVARACRVNAEMAYLGGLLHNIGIPVLLRTIDRQHIEFDDAGLEDALRAHASSAGVALIHAWSLPEQVSAVIARHADGGCEDSTVRIVASAMWLAQVDPSSEAAALVGAPALQRVNLYPEDVERLWRGREKVAAMIEALAI